LGDILKKNFDLDIELVAGSNGIFDVSLDGKMIYSKSEQRRFPQPADIIKIIKEK
jgi:selT/selW/selH-like putative selenoprotein